MKKMPCIPFLKGFIWRRENTTGILKMDMDFLVGIFDEQQIPTPRHEPDVLVRLQELEAEVTALKCRIENPTTSIEEIKPIMGFYTFNHFSLLMGYHLGRNHSSMSRYVEASKSGIGVRIVSQNDIARWRHQNMVPDWAVDQLSRMRFPAFDKHKSPWSETEYDFLRTTHLDNPSGKNWWLAEQCSEKFGRPISENGIRGALDRLRKRALIPRYRNPKRLKINIACVYGPMPLIN